MHTASAPDGAAAAGPGAIPVRVLHEVRTSLSRWRVPHPRRPFWRLYWNADDGAAVRHGAEESPLGPDRLVAVAPQTAFRAVLRRRVGHLAVHFVLGEPWDRLEARVVSCRLPQGLRAAARRLWAHETAMSPRGMLDIAALIGCVLGTVEATAWPPRCPDPRIRAVLERMEAELARPWRNAELARVAQMTPNALSRRFRQLVGRAPQAHLRARRIERARTRLEHEDASIEEIASALGFASRSHFSTVFRRQIGVGPAQYRSAVRAETAP